MRSVRAAVHSRASTKSCAWACGKGQGAKACGHAAAQVAMAGHSVLDLSAVRSSLPTPTLAHYVERSVLPTLVV